MLLINDNVFTEVSITLRSITLVGFKKDLQEPSVVIVAGTSAVDITNGTIIIHVNEAPIIEGEVKELISTLQARYIYTNVEDVSKNHSSKQKIYSKNRIILLKLHCRILHVTIRKPNDW